MVSFMLHLSMRGNGMLETLFMFELKQNQWLLEIKRSLDARRLQSLLVIPTIAKDITTTILTFQSRLG